MELTQLIKPYELLVRWDEKTGALKGYHLKTVTTIMNGAELLAVKEGDTMNATDATAAGFPLATILQAIQVEALVAVDFKAAELIASNNANAEAIAQLTAEKNQAVAAMAAEIVTKTAELVATSAVAAAALKFSAKVLEVAATEKDDPARATKEQEAELLAAQVAEKESELALIRLPETAKPSPSSPPDQA